MKEQLVTSTEWYQVPITVKPLGVPYDPTGDSVFLAFVPTGTRAVFPGDYQEGQWQKNTTGQAFACVLVGPANGGIILNAGEYDVYAHITDNPEVPEIPAGQLRIY